MISRSSRPPHQADRQHALGVQQLAGAIDRHEADGKAARSLLPFAHRAEPVVAVQRLGSGDQRREIDAAHASFQTGGRLSRNA